MIVVSAGVMKLCNEPSQAKIWVKSSCRQENSAIILVLGEFRSIYLHGSLNFRVSPHQISPKI
jgi:hypothetical protein